MEKPNIHKYTPEDIERIFTERVEVFFHNAELKPGTIAEWTLRYPNGHYTAQVTFGYPMYASLHNAKIGQEVAIRNIKDELWKLCGQYTLATGEKL